MAFHTFKHPDFESKYRNYRLITQDQPKPPVTDFVAAEKFGTSDELRLVFTMTDEEWKNAQNVMQQDGYCVYNLGGLASGLPD